MISDRIVVIDDDPRVIKSIKLVLRKYEIKEFLDSEKALAFFKKPRDIKIVLLDVMMPGIDGLSLLSEIKRYNKDISVIIMTGYGTKEIILDALRSHADDFIEKPFNFEDLIERIDRLLQEKRYSFKEREDDKGKIDKIKSFIRRNYQQATLDIIAEEMCMSSKYLSRMFKRKNGDSFRDFKLKIKIAEAKAMLKDTSFNVSEIALKLGYKNPESFMRIFKRITNCTPLEYRAKIRAEEHNSS